MSKNPNNLVWLDLEMTGLDPDTDTILEIATIITDSNINIIATGPVLAIHHPDSVLDNMNKWCIKQHKASGLTQRVRDSEITLQEAENQTLEFIKQYVPRDKSPMCGNSICQDRRFLYRYMRKLEEYFHYRNLDVSTLKELAKRWYPDFYKQFNKKSVHLALDDIKESIDELNHYRKLFTTEKIEN